MARRLLSSRPDPQSVVRSVSNGLRIDASIIGGALQPQITFEPAVGLIAKRIDKLGVDIRSFREPLKRAIKQVIIPSIQQNFKSGGRPKWPELSPATFEIAARGIRRPISSILVSTGKLSRAASAFARWDISREAAIFRRLPSSVWYGNIHQAGAKGPGDSFIPQRRFVMLQEEDQEEIQKVFMEWLEERIDRALPEFGGL